MGHLSTNAPARSAPVRSSGVKAVFWGGLIAGTLDILAAFINSGLHGGVPLRVLQGVASGLIGRSSFSGGLATALLGLLCHFLIAFGAAGAYYGVSRVWPVLVYQAVICGLLYGIPVYLVTNYVVVPLSRIGHIIVNTPGQMITALIILMVCVGLPISLAVRRFAG